MQRKNISTYSKIKQNNTALLIAPTSNLTDVSAAAAANAKYHTLVWHRQGSITKGRSDLWSEEITGHCVIDATLRSTI